MKKILNSDYNNLAQHHKEINEAYGQLNALTDDLNKKINAVIEAFKVEHDNELVSLEEKIEGHSNYLCTEASIITEKMESYISDRSESWHDSDASEAYTEWLEDWEDYIAEVSHTPSFDIFDGLQIRQVDEITLPLASRNKI